MKKSLKNTLLISATLLLLASSSAGLNNDVQAKHYHHYRTHRIYIRRRNNKRKTNRRHRINRHHYRSYYKKRRKSSIPSDSQLLNGGPVPKHLTSLQRHYLNRMITVLKWSHNGGNRQIIRRRAWHILNSSDLMSRDSIYGLNDGELLIRKEYHHADPTIKNYTTNQYHKVERYMLKDINQDRENNGMGPLTVDSGLQQEAEAQAKRVEEVGDGTGSWAYNQGGNSLKDMAKLFNHQMGYGSSNNTKVGIGVYWGNYNGWSMDEQFE